MSWLKVGDVIRDARPDKEEMKRLQALVPSVARKTEFLVTSTFGSMVQVNNSTCHPARHCQRISRTTETTENESND